MNPSSTAAMRPFLLLPFVFLGACERHQAEVTPADVAPPAAPATTVPAPDPDVILSSVIRISTTQQAWNQGQPWEKLPPGRRRSLGAIVAPGQVLTTAEMAADATYIELESPDGKQLAPAKVIAVDFEANLALLGLGSESDAKFFEGTRPLEMAAPPKIGASLDIVQVEENGTPLVTPGSLLSIDVVSNFLPGQFFLTYELKASMQSAANSFSLPVLHDGKLAGLLTSYDSKDQISDVTATDIVARFVQEAADGEYAGFPSLGISISRTDDANFRAWLKLPADAVCLQRQGRWLRRESGPEKGRRDRGHRRPPHRPPRLLRRLPLRPPLLEPFGPRGEKRRRHREARHPAGGPGVPGRSRA